MVVRNLTAPRADAAPRMRQPANVWQRIWRMRLIYLFLLPAFVLFVVFEYWPTILVFREAFY
nr:hypothetical protein [Chloroflexota bacterium]